MLSFRAERESRIQLTTIGKSRVAIDPIAMRTSWRSNSDIASVTSIGYPRMSASGESWTTMHRLLHASGSHPIPTPYDPKRTFIIRQVIFQQLEYSLKISRWYEINDEESSAGALSVDDISSDVINQQGVEEALNDMVKEYRKLSHTFEEIKAENASLKNNSAESSSEELEDTDSLKTELSKLRIENELLRSESSELKTEVDKLTKEMSSWNQSTRSLFKLYESQKPLNDKTGVGFNYDSSHGETSTQSLPVYDKFNERSFVKGGVIHDCIESIRYDDQDTSQLDRKGKGKAALEALTRSARTNAPRKTRPEQFPAKFVGGGGGAGGGGVI
ncbi:cell division cycle 5-like protein [Dorcoceras hygrometricum]|uniref:Cell division cycle 5-like protein n=1 Tax=Dorcoceras hygrometricum TaxID=472368 RepID=A0A2Z7CA59_9LAMI|nr:cell division cycle 5-like protein [Dorcoceras hygrometricum]